MLRKLEVLSIFDQARTCREDKHLLKIDYTPYDGDTDMEYMIKMLLSMASDPDMQYQMNLEDEYIFPTWKEGYRNPATGLFDWAK